MGKSLEQERLDIQRQDAAAYRVVGCAQAVSDILSVAPHKLPWCLERLNSALTEYEEARKARG
jgi:hypothetical protein